MMKRKNWIRFLSCLMALALLLTLTLPVFAEAADDADDAAAAAEETENAAPEEKEPEEPVEVVTISTAEELLEFAADCALDTWSQNRRFELTADITLEGEFTPVPTFGGTFDGGGHTIRDLSITQSASPSGLFACVQAGASIVNLNVEGSVCPDGESESVGGIAGENNGEIAGCNFTGTVSGTRNTGGIAGKNGAEGVIRSCTTGGALFGENMTGGIAGYNLGWIDMCRNNQFVNIESTDPAIDLSRINLSFSLDIGQLTRIDTLNIATDTGGIAGYSSGTISNCTNQAAIGHEHIGYNVGGITGRSCGQIRGCVNEGGVCGRKDVGGIVGQMEPYISIQLSESTMDQVQKQLKELNKLVAKASDDAEGGANGVTSRLNSISDSVGSAAQAAEDIRLTAGIDTTVKGQGGHDSVTGVSGEVDAVDAAASHNRDDGLDISVGDGSVSIDLDQDHDAGLTIGSSGSLQIDHSGAAGGVLDASTQIVAAPDLGGLTSAISGISGQLTMLNGAISGTVGTLADDVRQINDKFDELSQTIFDAVDEARGGVSDTVTDVSDTDVETITFGKASECRNSGTVYGDINAGGVAGSMAIEYELDPEDDVTEDLSGDYRRQYEYRAVILRCKNDAAVTSKRNYAGGICGRMDLGLIDGCESYGAVGSEGGSYVGGIAGVTAATIRGSYAKCTLSGQKYVGGIVGSGVAEKLSGDGSTVAGCYSMVDITDCTQYSGAISGYEAGSYLENLYVSDSLAGVNRRSYSGQAEPVDYEQLLELPHLPRAMQTLTLRFVADEQTIFSTDFDYGASFDAADFPAIPEKDGCIAAWDRSELENLHFDTVVTAVYTPYIPGLASEAVREDGRPVMMAEGRYQEGDTLRITAEPLTPAAFHIHTGSIPNRISGYLSTIGTDAFSLTTANWEAVEQWSVQLPDDGAQTHTLRYLAPDGQTKRLRVYAETDGVWEKLPTQTMGSYVLFPVSGGSARISVVSTIAVWWIWVLLLAVLGLIAFLVIHFVRKAARKARARSAVLQTAGGPPEQKPVYDTPSAPAETTYSAADEALLQRAVSAEERLAQAEEELRILRGESDASAPQADHMPPEQPETSATEMYGKKRKKRFKWWIPAVIVAALLAAAAAVLLLRPSLRNDLEAYYLLKTCAAKDPLSMELTVSGELGGESYETDASVYRTKVDGNMMTCIQRGGVRLYYSGATLYLENGRAFNAEGMFADSSELIDRAAELYRLVDVEVSANGGQKIYTAAASGSDAAELTAILMPAAADVSVERVDMALTAENGALKALAFSADSGSLSLRAELTLAEGKKAPAVPEAVKSAISGGKTGGKALSEELFSLIAAWDAALSGDTVSADIAVSADCGPIVLNDTLQYDVERISGQSFSCIRREPLALYFSGDRMCDASGSTSQTDSGKLMDTAGLVELCYRLALNGEVSSRGRGNGTEYTLTLDEDAMREAAQAIAPDTRAQSITYRDGALSMYVEDGTLRSASVRCAGAIHIVVADAEASLGAEVTFVEREVDFPQQVIDALRK